MWVGSLNGKASACGAGECEFESRPSLIWGYGLMGKHLFCKEKIRVRFSLLPQIAVSYNGSTKTSKVFNVGSIPTTAVNTRSSSTAEPSECGFKSLLRVHLKIKELLCNILIKTRN